MRSSSDGSPASTGCGAAWLRVFFEVLRDHKRSALAFSDALCMLEGSTASFASKLVATIDANQPVIDSVVLRNVGLRLPLPTPAIGSHRLSACIPSLPAGTRSSSPVLLAHRRLACPKGIPRCSGYRHEGSGPLALANSPSGVIAPCCRRRLARSRVAASAQAAFVGRRAVPLTEGMDQ